MEKFTAPSFPMYVSKFLIDTAELSIEQVGIYIRLLMYQWENGTIPYAYEKEKLARLCGCSEGIFKKNWAAITPYFDMEINGRLANSFMENVRNDKKELYGKLRKAGTLGVEAKKEKRRLLQNGRKSDGSTSGTTDGNPITITIDTLNSNSNISPDEKKQEIKNSGLISEPPPQNEGLEHPPPPPVKPGKKLIFYDYDKETSCYPFMEFWVDYGKSVDKELSLKKYRLLGEEDRLSIKEYLPGYKATKPDKQFRRDPCTFLNRRTWENEIIYPTEQPPLAGSGIGEKDTDFEIKD